MVTPHASSAAAAPAVVIGSQSFADWFDGMFAREFARLFRFINRLSGDPDLAADLAQEAFIRLHRRGSRPDAPEAWLITVAMNLFRNTRSMRSRHRRLLTVTRAENVVADPSPSPDLALASEEARARVRAAVNRLGERDRSLLLLRAEGYSYRDIALALQLNDASVGTLLARAKQAFREAYQNANHAS